MGIRKFLSPPKEQPVQKKKVKPYPFDVQMEPYKGSIVKIVPTGFLAEVLDHVKLGEAISGQFRLPASKYVIGYTGVIAQIHNQIRETARGDKVSVLIVEVAFKSLTPGGVENIESFIHRIGQKD